MSHIVTIKTQMKDPDALAAACERIGVKAPTQGAAFLYFTHIEGTIVYLKGWTYPVVITQKTGEIRFDNYQGQWGDIKELNSLRQGYAVELAKIEARKKGFNVSEVKRSNGTIEVVCVTR